MISLKLSHPVGASNALAGWLFLLPLYVIGGLSGTFVSAVIVPGLGLIYVLAFSSAFAHLYSKTYSREGEIRSWLAFYFTGLSLWACLLSFAIAGFSWRELFFITFTSLVFNTIALTLWQLLALAIRQFLSWRKSFR